jgi:hypothetical protein
MIDRAQHSGDQLERAVPCGELAHHKGVQEVGAV